MTRTELGATGRCPQCRCQTRIYCHRLFVSPVLRLSWPQFTELATELYRALPTRRPCSALLDHELYASCGFWSCKLRLIQHLEDGERSGIILLLSLAFNLYHPSSYLSVSFLPPGVNLFFLGTSRYLCSASVYFFNVGRAPIPC